jgi:rifampin ADP-ribosylating transferase
MNRNLNPDQFFHGTVRKFSPGDVIAPGHSSNFGAESDPRYAYATGTEPGAWSYAEKAWHADPSGTSGPPRVYEVEPIGRHSKDPQVDSSGRSRGNYEKDRRSKNGWRVKTERPMPESMGSPEDWR